LSDAFLAVEVVDAQVAVTIDDGNVVFGVIYLENVVGVRNATKTSSRPA
jgi:hypothetical protein